MSDLILTGADGETRVPETWLVIGVDETGHENLSRAHHPVFGLGFVALRTRDYGAIDRRFRAFKYEHFGSRDYLLHMADEGRLSPARSVALANFFRGGRFVRGATLITTETKLPADVCTYKIAARRLLDGFARAATHYNCDGMVMIHEESARTDALAFACFEGYTAAALDSDRSAGGQIPFLKFKAPKSAGLSILQMADVVAHTARAQSNDHVNGRAWGSRRDFQAVFQPRDSALDEFFQVESVTF